jgi:GNAT superfamily N-acetyltransferase
MAMTDQVTFRTYQRSDRAWVIRENLRFYSSVHGFDASFADALMAALEHLETQLGHPTSTYLIAENPTEPIGCIFLSADNHGTTRIRLFYLVEERRGKGFGAMLLSHVIARARDSSFNAIRVSTFDGHPEACRLYETFGFAVVSTIPSNAFGLVMRQLDYELTLSANMTQ